MDINLTDANSKETISYLWEIYPNLLYSRLAVIVALEPNFPGRKLPHQNQKAELRINSHEIRG